MNQRTVIAFTLIFFIQGILLSCNLFCPCGCGSSPEKRIDILSWRMKTLSDLYQEADTTAVHTYNQVFKTLQVADRSIAIKDKSHGSSMAAYACSPAPLRAVQSIQSLRITALNRFTYLSDTDLVQPGDDITNRFVMSYVGGYSEMPVDQFVNQLIIYEDEAYRIGLKNEPHRQTTLRFTVTINLSDGKVSELKDEILKVK